MRPLDYILLLLLCGAFLVYYINQRRKPKPRRSRRPGNQLTRRESKAWRKLQVQGYKLEEIHPTVPVTVTYDQKEKGFTWEGNFTVTRGGKSYLVRVVRGDGASSATSAAGREALLLDQLVFQPHGFFLYDEGKDELLELQFAFENGAGSSGRNYLLMRLGLILIITVGLVLLFRFLFGGGFL